MLSAQVYDVIETTRARLRQCNPQSADDVRCAPALVAFGDAMTQQSGQLKKFLFDSLYRHPSVEETMAQAKVVVRDLFAMYTADPQEMQFAALLRQHEKPQADRTVAPVHDIQSQGPDKRARIVADYIAGMTDRFAAREHERLFGQRLIA